MHRQVLNCIGDMPTNFTRCLCKNTHSLVPRSPFFFTTTREINLYTSHFLWSININLYIPNDTNVEMNNRNYFLFLHACLLIFFDFLQSDWLQERALSSEDNFQTQNTTQRVENSTLSIPKIVKYSEWSQWSDVVRSS
jgi:hypothetical protein